MEWHCGARGKKAIRRHVFYLEKRKKKWKFWWDQKWEKFVPFGRKPRYVAVPDRFSFRRPGAGTNYETRNSVRKFKPRKWDHQFRFSTFSWKFPVGRVPVPMNWKFRKVWLDGKRPWSLLWLVIAQPTLLGHFKFSRSPSSGACNCLKFVQRRFHIFRWGFPRK